MSTSLHRKLGLKDGMQAVRMNEPSHYDSLISDFQENIDWNSSKKDVDFVHVFCSTLLELEKFARKGKEMLAVNGMMWISWPKGASKIPTEINRETVRDYVLGIGLVDVKVVSIDENWSGLKFVYRLKDRPTAD